MPQLPPAGVRSAVGHRPRRLDPESYLEHSESWYRKSNGFARTPGHPNNAGVRYRTFDPNAAILRCFGCHSTGPLVSRPTSRSSLELGVRCDACHGPAAAHLPRPCASPKIRLTADQLNDFCGGCHRMPAAAGDTPNLRAPWNARHQPLLLAASACFKSSQGKLS